MRVKRKEKMLRVSTVSPTSKSNRSLRLTATKLFSSKTNLVHLLQTIRRALTGQVGQLSQDCEDIPCRVFRALVKLRSAIDGSYFQVSYQGNTSLVLPFVV